MKQTCQQWNNEKKTSGSRMCQTTYLIGTDLFLIWEKKSENFDNSKKYFSFWGKFFHAWSFNKQKKLNSSELS